jgi:hypothetical protein
VKTGALTLESNLKDVSSVSEIEARADAPVDGNVCSVVSSTQDCEVTSEDDGTAPDVVSVEESAVDGIESDEVGSSALDDEDLLDLLVDTLDVEFDPNLLVA